MSKLTGALFLNLNRVRAALSDFVVAYDDQGEPEQMLTVYHEAADALDEQDKLLKRADAHLATRD